MTLANHPSGLFPIRVASGLAIDLSGKILMGKRKSTGLRPGLWELPGGKVERGETSEEALCREWLEELGVVLSKRHVGFLLAASELLVEHTFLVELYPVYLPSAVEPQALDHSELAWVDLEQAIAHLPCSPAFYLHYRAILAWREFAKGQPEWAGGT